MRCGRPPGGGSHIHRTAPNTLPTHTGAEVALADVLGRRPMNGGRGLHEAAELILLTSRVLASSGGRGGGHTSASARCVPCCIWFGIDDRSFPAPPREREMRSPGPTHATAKLETTRVFARDHPPYRQSGWRMRKWRRGRNVMHSHGAPCGACGGPAPEGSGRGGTCLRSCLRKMTLSLTHTSRTEDGSNAARVCFPGVAGCRCRRGVYANRTTRASIFHPVHPRPG